MAVRSSPSRTRYLAAVPVPPAVGTPQPRRVPGGASPQPEAAVAGHRAAGKAALPAWCGSGRQDPGPATVNPAGHRRQGRRRRRRHVVARRLRSRPTDDLRGNDPTTSNNPGLPPARRGRSLPPPQATTSCPDKSVACHGGSATRIGRALPPCGQFDAGRRSQRAAGPHHAQAQSSRRMLRSESVRRDPPGRPQSECHARAVHQTTMPSRRRGRRRSFGAARRQASHQSAPRPTAAAGITGRVCLTRTISPLRAYPSSGRLADARSATAAIPKWCWEPQTSGDVMKIVL